MSDPRPLDPISSIKVKIGLLVAVSVAVAATLGTLGSGWGVPAWVTLPVTVLLALLVTQVLARGMTDPLRQMTAAARRMAAGDYAVRIQSSARDEIGELAEAFSAMATDLATADRQRRDLVANVSHELRTPLTALHAQLENVVDGVTGPQGAAEALAQSDRVNRLLEDLLDLSKVDAGSAALDVTEVDLRALVDETIAQVTPRPVEYDVRVPSAMTVRVDRDRLGQVLTNLVDNAGRHSPRDGVVRIEADRSGDRWHLEVTDEGPGVAPEDRDRAFERFGTVGTPAGGGGTGLGLAIARWITHLHGGEIGFVDGPAGSGARVRLDLPQDVPVVTPAEPEQAPAPVTGPTVIAPPSPWPERGLAPDRRVPFALLGIGVLAGSVLPDRHTGVGTTLVLLAIMAVVVTVGRARRDRFALACGALCGLFALVPTVRDAEWLTVLSVLAGIVLAAAGLSGAATLSGMIGAAAAAPLAALRGAPWFGRSTRAVFGSGQGSGPRVLRTTLWSVLALVVFGLLFSSADALFATWVEKLVPDLHAELPGLRIFIGCFVAIATSAAVYFARNAPRTDVLPHARPSANRWEWVAPVLVADLLFAGYLIAQAAAFLGGHDYVRRTTGLSYAEYVHQGFAQLTIATVLTLLVTWVAGRKAAKVTAADRFWLRLSLGLLLVQTLAVVASALHRMNLYQEAYGFTQLRLIVDVFEGWLGVVVLAVLVAGAGLKFAWLPRFALLSGGVALLGLAAINPEAWIATHNIERYEATGRIDVLFLEDLSADAAPALTDLPDDVRGCVLHPLRDRDWLEWNLGWARADGLADQPRPPAGCASLIDRLAVP